MTRTSRCASLRSRIKSSFWFAASRVADVATATNSSQANVRASSTNVLQTTTARSIASDRSSSFSNSPSPSRTCCFFFVRTEKEWFGLNLTTRRRTEFVPISMKATLWSFAPAVSAVILLPFYVKRFQKRGRLSGPPVPFPLIHPRHAQAGRSLQMKRSCMPET